MVKILLLNVVNEGGLRRETIFREKTCKEES